jgi:tripeptidyl-peptidase-1
VGWLLPKTPAIPPHIEQDNFESPLLISTTAVTKMLSMKFCTFFVFSLLAARSIAAPSSRYAVHQTRDNNVLKLIPRDDILNREATIPLSIGLAQSNLAHADQFLMDVSHPDSPNYGKHWTPKKVDNSF